MKVKERAAIALPRELRSFAVEATEPPDRVASVTVALFACFIVILILSSAFFTDRNGDVDELMMSNPAYMLAHFGKLTFPTYSYRSFYDLPVIIHPPIHLGLIGLFEKLHFTWYYAEAMPTVFFLLLGILVIVFSPFPAPVQLGLLFSVGFLIATGENIAVAFGVRPEGEVHAAWFAGLLLLESGRLANWNRTRLFGGAFLLVWASGVHYYACAALVGVVVYALWAVYELGWPKAESIVATLIAGGCLFGIPYVVLYLEPHLKEILYYVQMAKGTGGIATSIRLHWNDYQVWAQSGYIPALIRKPMVLGIPLSVFSTLVLLAMKSTRGIALAAIPLQVFIFLFAAHKLPNYLVHEIAMFVAAITVGGLVSGWQIWQRFRVPLLRRAFTPGVAFLLCLYLAVDTTVLRGTTINHPAHVHEGDLARAAARQILGPHARVTGRLGAWYSSGADYWWDIDRDMLERSHYDPVSFFSNFDAVVEYAHQSDASSDRTISSWYADGTLKLRGFFFGATNAQLQTVLLSTQRVPRVTGYAASGDRLFRFEEDPAGDYRVIAAACSMTPQLVRANWRNRWAQTFSAVLYLPNPPAGSPATVVTVLTPATASEPADWMQTSCKQIVSLTGTLKPADKNALLQDLRQHDSAMKFPRLLQELPGYRAVELPQEMLLPRESVRVDHVIALEEIGALSARARVERIPQIRVSTIPSIGALSASMPVKHADVIGMPCWIELRVKVLSGEIGFAAMGPRGIVARTPMSVLKGDEPIDVVVPLPNLRDVNQVVIFNSSHLAGAQVDVLDAAVFVSPDDFQRNRAALAALK